VALEETNYSINSLDSERKHDEQNTRRILHWKWSVREQRKKDIISKLSGF
jgi:hypothetical protein